MSVAALALGGITSALVIASRATDTLTGTAAQATDARVAADWITADLNHALSFSEQTTTSVTFTVPDRDNDGNNETIRYAWSGTAGDPLTRTNTAGTEIMMVDNVENFRLSYLVRPLLSIPAEQTTGTSLLSYCNPSGGSARAYDVDNNDWCAQYFKPDLPTNTVSWSVNYVYLRLRWENNGRTLRIQIRSASERQVPTSQILEEVTVSTNGLPWSYDWCGFSFSDQVSLDPVGGACLVVCQNHYSKGASVRYNENSYSTPQNSHWTTSGNAGDSWSTPVNNRDMLFYAYGTITTEGAAEWP